MTGQAPEPPPPPQQPEPPMNRLVRLVNEYDTAADTQRKWLTYSKVAKAEDLTTKQIEAIIVKIESKNSPDALVNTITYLNEHDVTLRSIEILESNLENVFLHLTGKKLRE